MKNRVLMSQLSQSGEYWGLWAGIDLKSCDPGFIRSEQKIKEFVAKLCDRIKMKRFGKTVVVDFGEDERVSGYSMVQLIETSSITGHFVNQTNNIFLDIFSCSLYDPVEVAEFAKEFFKAKSYILNQKIRK
ncbi:S-adenosylmethionine decarboxylase [Candidatus Pacearchaeota archaeon]|nr:S-adenosylmethionine decarboxylase [Candidatus Pacearchaeota archaeon]